MPEMPTAAHWWRESSEVFNNAQAPPPAQPEGKLGNENPTPRELNTKNYCHGIKTRNDLEHLSIFNQQNVNSHENKEKRIYILHSKNRPTFEISPRFYSLTVFFLFSFSPCRIMILKLFIQQIVM